MVQSGSESNDLLDERLSAAIDNELSTEECNEVLDELTDTPELQRVWERHHAVNALLRGEEAGISNTVEWDRLHTDIAEQRPERRSFAEIIDFSTLRERYLVKTIGGTALAASVLLGVSMVFVMQQSGPSMQAQPLASESTYPANYTIPPIPTPDPIQSRPPIDQDFPTQERPQPEVFLASDEEVRDERAARLQRDSQRSRGMPPTTNQPNRDLVHLASDKSRR